MLPELVSRRAAWLAVSTTKMSDPPPRVTESMQELPSGEKRGAKLMHSNSPNVLCPPVPRSKR